ncbi:MAG: ATP-binding protein [Lachnospiraceae bacterium]|nr:ATP-binding protein [Lachnospiraceae bacterium]
MSIRIRVTLIIIITNLIIVLFSVLVGIVYIEDKLDTFTKTDMDVIADVADHYISKELSDLKNKAREMARRINVSDEADRRQLFAELINAAPEFIGLAVFDESGALVASGGDVPAKQGIMDDRYINQAYRGSEILSSTYPTDHGVVFYLAVPFPSDSRMVLVATLPGMHFSDFLSAFVIWETGHIFVSDAEGYAVANPREHWVQGRFNYINAAITDPSYIELGKVVTLMTRGESGFGYYSISGVPRICSYRPIQGSVAGWSLGVVAPLTESPTRNAGIGMLLVGLVSMILSLIAAIVASDFIRKPFEKIAALKEESDAANKAKSTFLRTMSHEIRTPMNAILGITEIQLHRSVLDADTREAFERVYASGDMLLGIINDILDLSKIEAGMIKLDTAEYEIASMISDTAQLNSLRIGSKPIEFELVVDEKMSAAMVGDELRVKQILNNLLSNAFKYTAAGKVSLSVSEKIGENPDLTELIINVRDTGQGMTKEQVGKLFDQYTRFNHKANYSTEGTGLGMSITRDLIHLMSGDISVKSELGIGTDISVRLPQGIAGGGRIGSECAENLRLFRLNSRAQMKRVQITREPMPYGKILIVDDVETNIYVAKGLMAPYELQISSAVSGMEAIEKIKNGAVYDIIFMDHMMPQMDGIETMICLREMGYNHPIVALTANAIAGQASFFLDSGFDDFISKPIDIRQLNVILNRLIRDKQPAEVVKAARLRTDQGESISSVPLLKYQHINGLDIKGWLNKNNNDEAALLLILRSYVIDIRKILDSMGEVKKEELAQYKIKAHGIKGVSYAIMANQVGKMAEELEKACESGDYDFVEENNPPFLKAAINLVNELEEMLLKMPCDSEP